MSVHVVVVYARDGLRVATFGSICLTVVCSPLTSEYLREAHRAGRDLSRAKRAQITSLTLVRTGVPLPDAALRAEASKVTRESSQWISAAANVVHGEGFAASAMRSVITAMNLLGGGPPRRTFAQPSVAVAWLAERMAVQPSELAPVVTWSEDVLRDERP